MASPVPPDKDFDLSNWSGNFSTRLTATPTAYGSDAATATAYAGLHADFEARLLTATTPATRTQAAVDAKNVSKKALVAKARQVIRTINGYAPLTSTQRVELGLNPRDAVPTPVPAPVTRPMLSVDPDGTLRIVDETMPDSKAKPAGVAGALVFIKIDGEAPASVDEAKFAILATRFRSQIPLPEGSSKKTLWVLARWYNPRGELGPVSTLASTAIAA